MALSPGTRVGPYEVTAQIGAGGMGEVYRATDTKLKRQVALKILPPSLAADRDRLARFQREAEVLASLNHPNIAHIYGLEGQEGRDREGKALALVMELVEGLTLAELLAGPGPLAFGSGPGSSQSLPIEDALPIAKQIAEALEAAHEQGIIHRDLKPANIKVRPDGTVKVLDFGLAKAVEGQAGQAGQAGRAGVTNSPTITTPAMTQAGMILGTAAYMSPEQAKGREVDKRSDVWAFGAVLYEMLSGIRAFSGEDTTDVIAAVMKDTPNWSALPADVPAPIVTLIQRCLEKDRKTRIGDIAVARFLLAESASLGRPSSAAPVAVRARSRPSALAWALAGVLLITTLGVSLVHFGERPPLARSISFHVIPPESNSIGMFRISPDGRRLVFVGRTGPQTRLWVRSFDSVNAVPLTGTNDASYPFWSPDSTQIGFFAQGKLKKIPAAGGVAVNIADAVNGRGGTWNRDGVILFVPDLNSSVYRIADTGGPPVAVTTLGQGDGGDRFPEFLPDGQRFLYLHTADKDAGLYGGALAGGRFVRILPETTNAMYVPREDPKSRDGFLIFRRDNTLMAQPFDPDRLQATGGVVPIAEEVSVGANIGYGAFAASQDGTLAYKSGTAGNNRQLAWLDRSGKRLGLVSKPGQIAAPALSPDNKIVAFSVGNTTAGAADIWLENLESGVRSRFTFGQGASSSPLWSSDGKRIAFEMITPSTGAYSIRQMAATGTGRPDVLLEGPSLNTLDVTDWTRDGKLIVFNSRSDKTRDDLFLLTVEDDRKASVFLQTPAVEVGGKFSPDGQWLAYMSDESGGFEIYVRHIPDNGAKYQISSAGGVEPQWSPDGKELFYVQGRQTLMSVPVKLGATFERGPARQLFDDVPLGFFQPSADGQRFLVVLEDERSAQPAPITVVTNWPATLKK